jgi:hypothetical protein
MARKSQLLRAELAVAELEDALIDAKANGMPRDKLAALKADVREARRQFRAMRGGGGVAVSPETVKASGKVSDAG